ncbi:MAG: leucine-rich repeat domain-containing protein [Lachnospiraceae bacterium]
MAQEKDFKIGGVTLRYMVENEGVVITGCKGQTPRVEIPEEIEGLPVTAVGKKAFLSNKGLTEVVLPGTLTEIGDWAFAHCSSLKKMVLPGKNMRIGKGVFKDCIALAEVRVTAQGEGRPKGQTGENVYGEDTDRYEEETHAGQMSRLLAATPVMLDAEYLFLPGEAGSAEWLEKWDSRMMALLQKNDESGFTRLVLCGEEDLLANLPDYIAEKRRSKAEMCFLRLLNPIGLSNESKNKLREYLLTHAKGCESEAAWEVVLREHGDERSYYELLTDIGCVTEENLPDMLQDMKEGHAEMKAFLMRYKEANLSGSDFFDTLSLD